VIYTYIKISKTLILNIYYSLQILSNVPF